MKNSNRRILHIALTFGLLAVLFSFAPAPSLHAQSFSERAKCGVFYDKWEVEGAPPGILAMAGLGHESVAAQNCIAENNIAMACEHYRKILGATGRMNPALASDITAQVKMLMAEHKCE